MFHASFPVGILETSVGLMGGRHQFASETDHGHVSSRSSTRIFEDDNYRPSASRGDWRYNKNTRDGRVSFNQKEWKHHTWEMNNGSTRILGRLPDMNNDCLSADERPSNASDSRTAISKLSVLAHPTQQNIEISPVKTPTGNWDQNFSNQRLASPSHPHSVSGSLYELSYLLDKHDNEVCSSGRQCHDVRGDNTSLCPSNFHVDLQLTHGQLLSKDQKDDKVHGVNGIHIVEKLGKESCLGSINWKHPLWTHSGRFASRGFGFSHSSSSKSFGAVDTIEQKTEVLPKIVSVTESTSRDAASYFTSSCLPEETNSRKKPRLGWGEGLAKYEKKKVDVNLCEDGNTMLANSTGEAYSLLCKSPTMVNASDFGSPATPSSVACSSSPGTRDKPSCMAAKAVSDASNLCRSPSPVFNYQLERIPFNLEDAGNISMENLSCLLSELLRTDDSGPGDSCSIQWNVMNKVLAWKVDVLKVLELTESEIDLLENKRRALKFEAGSLCPYQIGPVEQGAPCVAERPEGAVHNAVPAKVSVDATGEGVERSQDTVDIPSIKTATSSTDVDMSSFAIGSTTINDDTVQLSSGCCSIASEEDVSVILVSNRKFAHEASEVFNMLLPRQYSWSNDTRCSTMCQDEVDPHIKQTIAVKRRIMRVKEKILVLQFKAFQLSWKRDMHQLAISKYNAKSHKKCESNLYIKNGAIQKLPQSVRLKFYSPAPGRESPPPTAEFLNFMGKLLLGFQHKRCRDILRMPAMILGEKEKVISRFISSNGLIEDPCAVEKERAMINPWGSEEREIFLDKLAMYGKDFRKIASHLEQKTTADCIDFYYKNHKSDCFVKIKKKLANGKERKCNFMLAPRKKWKREMGAASLDILGAVSVIAGNASKVTSTRQMSSKRITPGGSRCLHHSDNSSEGCFYNFDLHDKQTISADGLSGGDGSLSTGLISSCLRSSADPEERCRKYPKFDSTLKISQLSHATHCDNSSDEDDTCSEESFEETSPVHWTDEERSAFMQGFLLYGKNFAMISQCIGTRSQDQCKVFFSKVRKCLGLELIQLQSGNASTSASVDNSNEGGGSEMEVPCALEGSSVMCNDDLCAKMDVNLPNLPFNVNRDGADHLGSVKLKSDLDRSEQENGSACLGWKDGVEVVDTNASPVHMDCSDSVPKTVESQCPAVEKTESDQLLCTETNQGVLVSAVVSPQPPSSNATVLANLILKSFTERLREYSDSVKETANGTRDPPLIPAEAASSSGFSLPECLHHVPIEMCVEGVHLPQENSSSHSETGSPNAFDVHVMERHNLDARFFSNAHLSFGEKHQFYGQNSLQDVHVSNTTEASRIPWSSFMQDPSLNKRSKSDVIVTTTLGTGEDFSLNRCSSLTSNSTSAKQRRLSQKESRTVNTRRHSRSLSDTERPYKNEDLRLFGTIVTSHENERNTHHLHESIRQDLQNVPIASYGIWDGNRIRTGFTALQYPEAFAVQDVSSTSEVQVGSSREIQPDGLSVYTRRKLNGSTEIPVFGTQIDGD
ncbi:PREDICTED: uncharacterized protein LOC104806084 isoform X2 [Tarenaya hassleriana]|uniref:uncharacterized protein LOC104806084 isoform X2 n=1 Tax=Tarenaya hassleriana TaxID=28532 RepID=UPI00053C3081|nr:PREDICTED: uncharacterized protein LOC104806084 isoform X2 [Tarenaya hassleriana]